MITNRVWRKVREYGTPHTGQFNARLGVSHCHWFSPELKDAFHSVVARLPANSVYLELGTFLGAGSTAVALHANRQLKVICMDHWNITGEIACKFTPMNSYTPDTGHMVDFLQGYGSAFMHFCNNVFEDRGRVVPVRRDYRDQTLRELYQLGVVPDLIMIDDDHAVAPVLQRVRQIHKLWPKAQLVLDDYTDAWPGVQQGWEQALSEGLYPGARCMLLADRLLWVQPAI